MEAIRRATESEARLVFLYVVDVQIVGDYEERLEEAVRNELHWLGRSLLRVAQQRAEQAQVEAEIEIREGSVKEEIERFLRESQASLLLLGAPRDTSSLVFGDDAIEQFARMIEEDTGVAVQLVWPDEKRVG